MGHKRERGSHGRRPRVSLNPKDRAEALNLVRTMSGGTTSKPPDGPTAAFLADMFAACVKLQPGPSYYSALWTCGVWFTGYHEPENWPDPLKHWARIRRPEARQCFHNSAMAVISGPANDEAGLDYYEGFVAFPACPVPIEHAWLGTAAGGVAVDLTLPVNDAEECRDFSNFRAGAVYCGVKIPAGFLARFTIADECTGPRLSQWLAVAVDSARGPG